jgi:hypothetical protein
VQVSGLPGDAQIRVGPPIVSSGPDWATQSDWSTGTVGVSAGVRTRQKDSAAGTVIVTGPVAAFCTRPTAVNGAPALPPCGALPHGRAAPPATATATTTTTTTTTTLDQAVAHGLLCARALQ